MRLTVGSRKGGEHAEEIGDLERSGECLYAGLVTPPSRTGCRRPVVSPMASAPQNVTRIAPTVTLAPPASGQSARVQFTGRLREAFAVNFQHVAKAIHPPFVTLVDLG